jgi:hypothetical protein
MNVLNRPVKPSCATGDSAAFNSSEVCPLTNTSNGQTGTEFKCSRGSLFNHCEDEWILVISKSQKYSSNNVGTESYHLGMQSEIPSSKSPIPRKQLGIADLG